MQQTDVVAGYFASRAAAQRFLQVLSGHPGRTQLYAFGDDAQDPLTRLALGWLRPDEWLLAISCSSTDSRRALELLRRSGEAIDAAVLSPALLWQDTDIQQGTLTQRWRNSLGILQTTLRGQISQRARSGDTQQPAKWGIAEAAYENNLAGISLIEHRYILDGYIERLQDLIKASRGLAKLPTGTINGTKVPFVYELAYTAERQLKGRLTESRIKVWFGAKCSDQDLSRGEFMAIEPMLVVSLMEDLAEQVATEQRREAEVRLARLAATRIGEMPVGDLPVYWSQLQAMIPMPSRSMALLLLELLRDSPEHQAGLSELWGLSTGDQLSRRLRGLQRADADRLERFNRIVTSLRLLTRTDWALLVEDISPVVGFMRQDPSGHFARMDGPTRSWYADGVSDLAKWSRKTEKEVAAQLVVAAKQGVGVESHIGYYLIDDGRRAFERTLRARLPLMVRLAGWARRHPAGWFLGLLAVLTTALLVGFVMTLLRWAPGLSYWAVVGWSVVAFMALNQIALELAVYVTARVTRPLSLPKLRFPRAIPEPYQSLVVVPVLLRTVESTREELQRLEARYVANPEKGLSFGLLTDFTDAPVEKLATDEAVLNEAAAGIRDLQQRYPSGHFFLYHRPRVYCTEEGVWMGRERKRGKLEEFNDFIVGRGQLDWLFVGQADRLRASRFIITLDEDTELPPGAGKRLVEALAHPLNEPQLAAKGRRLLRGFGIIQPRVITSLESGRASRISRLLNGRLGLDPYMVSYSDLYYDLAKDAIFHGKGIYDPHVFDAVLGGRLPDNRILSHDLLEGSYLRVALATDIILFDKFPSNQHGLLSRQHRWVRGDWQIGAWIGRWVPTLKGRERNPLTLLNRWKVADNLRRSALPVVQVVGLVLAMWQGGPVGVLLSAAVLVSVVMPAILGLPGLFWAFVRFRRIDWLAWLQGLAENLHRLVMLPRVAWLSFDSIVRVMYRLNISRRGLLEWHTATDVGSLGKRLDVPSAVIALAALAGFVRLTDMPGHAAVFCLVVLGGWVLAPLVTLWLDLPTITRPVSSALSSADTRLLRQVALQTWRFFDELMSKDNHYLPPDNLQVTLKVEMAQRTSPTNIGLGLLAWLAARDLGYLSNDQMAERMGLTLDTIGQLETHRGHIYNWYRTDTLEPLLPRYVSMVDSGNLMGSLWAFRQGLLELPDEPIIRPVVADGWLELVEEIGTKVSKVPRALVAELTSLAEAAVAHQDQPALLVRDLEALVTVVRARETELRQAVDGTRAFYIDRLLRQATAWEETIDRYLGWWNLLAEPPAEVVQLWSPELAAQQQAWLMTVPTLAELSAMSPGAGLLTGEAAPVIAWWARIETERRQAIKHAVTAQRKLTAMADQTGQLADRMDMHFLYHPKRKVFHIGYNVEEHRLDPSFYDLLASEARLGSFAAVASGQVPAEHWWALGRNSRYCDNQAVLLSWSGTMFEYLMPRLLMREYPGTLLQQGMHAAVAVQRRYGERLEMPWGISESGHSALDHDNTYQYRAFGVPALGISSGLEQGTVAAPYAALLALSIDPLAALANLRQLDKYGFRGEMGFFEAVDYRRAATASGERGVGVYNYMAHHQGMGLIAIANLLQGDRFPARFHADIRVRAARTLLHERAVLPERSRQDVTLKQIYPLRTISLPPVVESTASLTTPLPVAHVLTNGRHTTMVTATGSGFSRWGDVELNRWSADALRNERGAYIYLKEAGQPELWSTTFEPTLRDDDSYKVYFRPEKAVFERRYQAVASHEEVYVAPDHDVEVRWVRLRNDGSGPREFEMTSVFEFGLAPHEAQAAHPAFNRLFIGIEALPEQDGILAHRRPRAATDQPVWTAHLLVNLSHPANRAVLQTDREQFLGRTSSPQAPAGLVAPDDVLPEYPLDPIAAVTQRFVLVPQTKLELAALTITASSREEVIRLANRYRQRSILARARQGAWTLRQAELRRLQITEAEALIFQDLAPYVIYPNRYLKQAARGLVSGGQSTYISYADLPNGPCMVAAIDDSSDVGLARQLGLAQKYFAHRGLRYPLVWLVKVSGEAGQRLHVQLEELAENLKWLGESDKETDIRVWSLSHLSEGVLQELTGRARVVLEGSDGPLAQQLAGVAPLTRGLDRPQLEPTTPALLALPERSEYHNGYGAFTDDGRSYVMVVSSELTTPAPWANILANSRFGSLVTERGGGFSWLANSQQYRLTPWQNEPLSDVPGELIYVHDLDTNEVWSPQPGYHPSGSAVVRHAPGRTSFTGEYAGLRYELMAFVPVDWHGPASVKIQRLRITNTTDQLRHLRLTNVAEWVLGSDREHWQERVITGWDDVEQMVLATNPAHPDYGQAVAFMAQNRTVVDFTTDRAEFLGPIRGDQLPHGLANAELSGRIGMGLDPVAVMRSVVEIPPGTDLEVDYFLGSAPSATMAAAAVRKLREAGSVTTALTATNGWWDQTLATITVQTPDRAVDVLFNHWLLHQVISSRVWGRTGYYQSSGAFGYRDQLQDSLSLVYSRPEITREVIIEAARHQYKEGDTQHWWMPGTARGLRTRMTDDRMWLPYVVANYVTVTGDTALLEERIPYLEGGLLPPGMMEDYHEASVSAEDGTIMDHCYRAIAISMTQGVHGLPLMGAGDWNDGLNRVGIGGQGESVWLGWFQVVVLREMADLLDHLGRSPRRAVQYRDQAEVYTKAIDKNAWDGGWYLRAFYDDGVPMGSAKNAEGRIDSIPQSWAVIAGTGRPERQSLAMEAAVHQLVDHEAGIVNLLTPAFDKSDRDPGYIKGYLPGTRENGGQYTHASLWVALALARMGRGDDAVEILQLLNPINHALTKEQADRYVLEPYVLAGDVYSLAGHTGRGGWSWYTGSAAWTYRVWLEEVFGFHLRGNQLTMNPCIDRNWPGFTLTYRYRTATYIIEVTNPHHICRGVAEQTLDGQLHALGAVKLVDDGATHHILVRLGH